VNTPSATLSRFVHQYRGIEGFYFLNKSGELGYIKADDLRSVKETFPQINDRHFLKVHPDFMDQLQSFLRDLGELSALCTVGSGVQMELGYVLPANEGSQTWRSATLVLHRQVVDTLRQDESLLYKKGIKDRYNSNEMDMEKLQGIRSVQHGLDDLTNHRDANGIYKFFPVLFYLRDGQANQSRLRVLNLKWRPGQAVPDGGHDSITAAEFDSRESVYSLLRQNLVTRGAINRDVRAPHRSHAM